MSTTSGCNRLHLLDRLGPVAGLADDGDALGSPQSSFDEAGAHQLLVVTGPVRAAPSMVPP